MGQQCVKLEALPVPKISVAGAPATGAFPGIQAFQEYNRRYDEIQEVQSVNEHSRHRVSEIRAKNSGLLYVCRRAAFAEAPMASSPGNVHKHLEALCELDHPHLAKLVEVFADQDTGDWLLVSERAETPLLLDYVEEQGFPNGDIDAAECVRQILSGLAYAHHHKIAHGRLRFSCVLLAAPGGGAHTRKSVVNQKDGEKGKETVGPPQVKVVDMGLGYILREPITPANSAYEGLLYMPPEMAWKTHNEELKAAQALSGDETEANEPPLSPASPRKELLALPDQPQGNVFTTTDSDGASSIGSMPDLHAMPAQKAGLSPEEACKTDVWAVGVLTFNLLSGMLPFEASDEKKLMTRIRTTGVLFTKDPWQDVSRKAVDCVRSMLVLSPQMRPSALEMLRHPWLKIQRGKVHKSSMFSLFRNAIVNFHECQFKKLVMRVIVEQMPRNNEHMMEATAVFRFLDKNRDGLLSYHEFAHGLKHLGHHVEKYIGSDVAALFDSADRNSSGALDAHEFAAATLPPSQARSEKALWNAFRAFDKDESGVIGVNEVVATALLLEGKLVAPEQLDELIETIEAELHSVNIVDNWSTEAWNTRATDLGEEASMWRRMTARVLSVLPLGSRPMDFGEFQYLCSIRPSDWKATPWARKEAFRIVHLCCDIDMYQKKHTAQLTWPPAVGSAARSPLSAYERKGLSAVDDVQRKQSRKQTIHRYEARKSTFKLAANRESKVGARSSVCTNGDEEMEEEVDPSKDRSHKARGIQRHAPRLTTLTARSGRHHYHHHRHHHHDHHHDGATSRSTARTINTTTSAGMTSRDTESQQHHHHHHHHHDGHSSARSDASDAVVGAMSSTHSHKHHYKHQHHHHHHHHDGKDSARSEHSGGGERESPKFAAANWGTQSERKKKPRKKQSSDRDSEPSSDEPHEDD